MRNRTRIVQNLMDELTVLRASIIFIGSTSMTPPPCDAVVEGLKK